MRKALALMACLMACQVMAADDWETSIKAAQAKAVKDKTDVLIVVGKDTKKLKDLLSEPAFKTPALKSHVLVVASSPEDLASIKTLVGDLSDPSMVVMDSTGRIYGIVDGYFNVNPEQYLQALSTYMAVRDDLLISLAAADRLEGIQKALVLHDAIFSLIKAGLFQNGSYYGYESVIKEIKALDKDNAGKLKSKWDFYDMAFQIRAQMSNGKTDAAIASLDKYIADYKGTDVEDAQACCFIKAQIRYNAQDMDGVKAACKECVAIDATTPQGKAAQELLTKAAAEEEKQRKELPPATESQKVNPK